MNLFNACVSSADNERERTEMVRQLILSGVDLEALDEWNVTPLFHAVINGNIESVKLLIAAGANVNAVAGEPGDSILASTCMSLALQCERFLGEKERYAPIVDALRAAGATTLSDRDSSQ